MELFLLYCTFNYLKIPVFKFEVIILFLFGL